MPVVRPKILKQKHVVPHFPPPTLMCDFGPERRPPRPKITYTTPLDPQSGDLPRDNQDTIPKPQGSVARPGRSGYTLRIALKWDKKKYTSVQVPFHLYRIYT